MTLEALRNSNQRAIKQLNALEEDYPFLLNVEVNVDNNPLVAASTAARDLIASKEDRETRHYHLKKALDDVFTGKWGQVGKDMVHSHWREVVDKQITSLKHALIFARKDLTLSRIDYEQQSSAPNLERLTHHAVVFKTIIGHCQSSIASSLDLFTGKSRRKQLERFLQLDDFNTDYVEPAFAQLTMTLQEVDTLIQEQNATNSLSHFMQNIEQSYENAQREKFSSGFWGSLWLKIAVTSFRQNIRAEELKLIQDFDKAVGENPELNAVGDILRADLLRLIHDRIIRQETHGNKSTLAKLIDDILSQSGLNQEEDWVPFDNVDDFCDSLGIALPQALRTYYHDIREQTSNECETAPIQPS